MQDVSLLRLQAEREYKALLDSFEGVEEGLAWARIQLQPGEYLHTWGSIISNVVHVAGCKLLYGSAAYRGLDVRGRDVVAQMRAFWPSWEGAKKWLTESHEYWMASWSGETDFERNVMTNWGDEWPSWKVISTMSHHDSYHAGQIALLRTAVSPTSEPPCDEGDEWEEYTSGFSW